MESGLLYKVEGEAADEVDDEPASQIVEEDFGFGEHKLLVVVVVGGEKVEEDIEKEKEVDEVEEGEREEGAVVFEGDEDGHESGDIDQNTYDHFVPPDSRPVIRKQHPLVILELISISHQQHLLYSLSTTFHILNHLFTSMQLTIHLHRLFY